MRRRQFYVKSPSGIGVVVVGQAIRRAGEEWAGIISLTKKSTQDGD